VLGVFGVTRWLDVDVEGVQKLVGTEMDEARLVVTTCMALIVTKGAKPAGEFFAVAQKLCFSSLNAATGACSRVGGIAAPRRNLVQHNDLGTLLKEKNISNLSVFLPRSRSMIRDRMIAIETEK
jgi:hypothetical protein